MYLCETDGRLGTAGLSGRLGGRDDGRFSELLFFGGRGFFGKRAGRAGFGTSVNFVSSPVCKLAPPSSLRMTSSSLKVIKCQGLACMVVYRKVERKHYSNICLLRGSKKFHTSHTPSKSTPFREKQGLQRKVKITELDPTGGNERPEEMFFYLFPRLCVGEIQVALVEPF